MEENEPKQRRPRTSNPAFSTPNQPTPSTKPAKAPPAVTFRPPEEDQTSSGTDADSTTAPPPSRPQRAPKPTPRRTTPPRPVGSTPPADQAPAPASPARERTRAQAAAKPQPSRIEAAAAVPAPTDEPHPPTKAQPTPAAKAQPRTTAKAAAKLQPPAAKATPAKRQPRKATPPVKATPAAPPAKVAPAAATPAPAPAKAVRPAKVAAKKAAATVKAAAAELAPAVVKPDMTTVPDDRPDPAQPPAPQDVEAAAGVRAETATSPAAEPPVTAPGQPGAAVPVGETLPRASHSVADTLSGIRTEAWAALVADPGHAPELLAVAATQTIGPRAQEWAARTRAAYPAATPDALARLATRQFTRFGSVSSVLAAVAGSYAPLALLGASAFTHAELALHVAAAYGLDPTERQRAVDLLVLTRVHPAPEDAEAALAAAEQFSYDNTGLTDATWRLGRMIAAQAGGWAVVRAANHFFPGTSLLVAALTSRGSARAMAARASLHYRGLTAS